MTNATTTTGVATLKQLNKECLNIDLTKVRLKDGWRTQEEWGDDWNAPLSNDLFHTDKNGENPHIKFGVGRKWNQVPLHEFFWIDQYGEIEKETWKEHRQNRNVDTATFSGGKRGRYGSVRTDFTDAKIMFDKSTDEILGVLYALDNDYLNEWLRQTIDPNILNNWDELHADKKFEVLIATTTYSQEKVVGRSYEECVETLQQNDPKINAVTSSHTYRFSGMKTASNGKGAKKILSSYEEWVSLNERGVA
jgi:hypothetical protein